jgi:hypothetical protein
MTNVPDLPLHIRSGGPLNTMACQPIAPYAPQVLSFLAALSGKLLLKPESRQHPDIAAFAFWCRSANLNRLARGFDIRHRRIGRGVVLHIAPGNVPVNFAFSLAFGMLAGNSNIVRIAETPHPQTDILCSAINRLFDDPVHAKIAAMNRVVQYPRDDAITAKLSASASARVLWGGDQTIAHLRAMPTSPRCIDIAFADRYSIAIFDSKAVLRESDEGILRLAQAFFNDVYLQDQGACSSPHLLFWLGPDGLAKDAQIRFWDVLFNLLKIKYEISPIQAMDKFVHLCRTATDLREASASIRYENLAYRVRLEGLPSDIQKHRGKAGFFFEYSSEDINCLKSIVDARYQTVTTFGIDRDWLAERVIDLGLSGIDRIVPVGQALDIGLIWDGYDLITSLSRIVHVP